MATYYSTQRTTVRENSGRLKPADFYGRKRTASATFTVPSGGIADGSLVELCELPKGATINGGAACHDGLGGTISIGIIPKNEGDFVGDYGKFLGATSSSSATTSPLFFAHTIALKNGYTLPFPAILVAAVGTGWTAGKKLHVGAEIVVD